MIVTPDASVLLKWVLPGDDEHDTDVALALRDQAVAGTLDLVVPQLWICEVGNTLARRFPDDADELLASLADFGLTEAPLDAKWRIRAVSLAVTYGVAFHDAAYHAVALGLGGVFVTADERYVRRASGAGEYRLCDAGAFPLALRNRRIAEQNQVRQVEKEVHHDAGFHTPREVIGRAVADARERGEQDIGCPPGEVSGAERDGADE